MENMVARCSAPRSVRGASMTNVFEEIYQTNVWGNSESHSGHGSSESATRFLRTELFRLLTDLGVRSMLDVPCGDFNWMRLLDLPGSITLELTSFPQLIEANQKKYSRPGRAFGLLDVVKDPLPRRRCCLQPRSSGASLRAGHPVGSRNIFDSGATYLVTTTFTSRDKNVDIPTGQWRAAQSSTAAVLFPSADPTDQRALRGGGRTLGRQMSGHLENQRS